MGADTIYQNLAGRFPVKRAVISQNTAATNQLIAAVTGKKIVVLGLVVKVANGQTLTFITGTSTAISGAMAFATSDLLYQAQDPDHGVFETGVGERFAVTMGAATQVSGHVWYCEV